MTIPGSAGFASGHSADPVIGKNLVMDRNLMVEQIQDGVIRPLDRDEMDGYRFPFPTAESRLPILRFIQMKPIGRDSETHPFFVRLQKNLSDSSLPTRLLTVEDGPLYAPEPSAPVAGEDP